jgi:hypothetical protein
MTGKSKKTTKIDMTTGTTETKLKEIQHFATADSTNI